MKEKILVVRYRFIGDTVLTVPFLRNLRRAYPDAQIDMLVGPVSGDVLLNCPYIDNFIVFDTTKKHKYENTSEKKQNFFSYVKLLRNQGYNKAYVLKRSFSSAALIYLAGIKERIGFNTEGRGFFLTKKVNYDKEKHEVECFLDVLKADNIKVQDYYLENWTDKTSVEKVKNIFEEKNIKDNKIKILIHATSGNKAKEWGNKNFVKVIEYLVNTKGAYIFHVGTKADKAVYEQILKEININNKENILNLCADMSIQDSLALIDEMDFVLGVDSGTLHLAASLNKPVIGIYGPMSPNKWKAWGQQGHVALYSDRECIPCGLSKKCKINEACLSDIKPEQVIEECSKMIEKL